jgi:hypothetical protein
MIKVFRKERKQEDEVPPDWATLPPQPEEPMEVTPWPPADKPLRPLNAHRYILWAAKLLFLFYVLVSVMLALNAPIGLLFTLPTILVILDYIRSDRLYSQALSWFDPDEKKQRDTAREG